MQDLREVVLGALWMVRTPSSLVFPAAATVLLCPQVALALLGGWMSEFVVLKVRQLAKAS